MSKIYVLYDVRAKSGDTDDATVLVTATTERETRHPFNKKMKADYEGVWYEYDDINDTLLNGVARFDL